MGLGGRGVCTGDARLQGARLWGAKGTTGRHVTSAVTGPRLRPVRTDLARLTPPQAPGPRPAVRVLPDETPPPEKPSSVPSGKRVASSPKLRRPRLELAPPGTPPRTHAEPLRKARPKNVLSFSRVLCPGSPGRTGCLSAALPETSAEPSAGRRPPALKPKLRVRPGPPESNQLRHREVRPTNPSGLPAAANPGGHGKRLSQGTRRSRSLGSVAPLEFSGPQQWGRSSRA